jgi:uncharacterized membrane protein
MAESGDAEQAVIASFDSQAQAEQAAKDLMGWDKANDDIKLGAIGVLTKDDKGEIKTRNYSERKTRKGAMVGVGLGAIAAVVSGGLTLIPSAIGGAVVGGAAGSLFRKGLGMSEEDLKKLSADLDNGRAALLVMCNAGEVQATSEYLTAAGGKPETHAVDATELEQAAQTEGGESTAPPAT